MNKTEAIPHKWIYANKGDSYDYKSYNMSFHGTKLYSYRSVLATIDRANDVICIDSSIANYSHTSGRHHRYLLGAIPGHRFTVFTFPFYETDRPAWYLKQCIELLDKQSRARKRDYTSSVIAYLDEALKYISVYGYDKRKSTYKQLMQLDSNRENMLEQVAGIIESERKAKLVAKRKEDKRLQKQRQTRLDNFTGGGVEFDPNYNGVYLRINGDKLQTTNSITVSLSGATTLYKRWVAGKDIIGAELDCYTVVKANTTTVKIGCTTIGATELHRVLGQTND